VLRYAKHVPKSVKGMTTTIAGSVRMLAANVLMSVQKCYDPQLATTTVMGTVVMAIPIIF
jgi:hypothetical protein